MLQKLLKWLGFRHAEKGVVDPRAEKMEAMLVQLDSMQRLLDNGTWKGRRAAWRATKITSTHANMFHLINTIRSTTNAVMSKTKPQTSTRLSRKYLDNLSTTTLDGYLLDDFNMTCSPYAIMCELTSAVNDLVNNIRPLSNTDDTHYDYYLRQCTHLFTELELVIKAYL